MAAPLTYLLCLELFGAAILPLCVFLFSRFPDRGYGFRRLLGVLVVGWGVWFLVSLHLASFASRTIWIVLAGVAALCWGHPALRRRLLPLSRETVRLIFMEEALFVGLFGLWAYLRGFRPDLVGTERFMDLGFVLSLGRSASFPPPDHFFAGESINYYYFGHYLAALLVAITRLPASIAYNLQMAFILAGSFTGLFSLSAALTRRRTAYWAGAVVGFFCCFAGNWHPVLAMLAGKKDYFYPAATRFIRPTIHEFPMYSFTLNDLHAHVSDMPLVILLMGLIAAFFLTRGTYQRSGLLSPAGLRMAAISFVLGCISMTNSWDFPIYSLLFALAVWFREAGRVRSSFSFMDRLFLPTVLTISLARVILVCCGAFLVAFPFWRAFESISKGIGIVMPEYRTPFTSGLIQWGIQLPLAAVFVLWAINRLRPAVWPAGRSVAAANSGRPGRVLLDRRALYTLLLLLVGAVCALLPEIIYVQDIYQAEFRANTMFKFSFQAWILFGIVAGLSVGRFWHIRDRRWRTGFRLLAGGMCAAGCVYTFIAVKQGLGPVFRPEARRGLDGLSYLATLHPDDFQAIGWLNRNIPGQPTLLEAVGESYSYCARVSSYTGLPAVLGWPGHEILWRAGGPENSFARVDARIRDVKTIYETPDPDTARELLQKYQVRLIYLGAAERKRYPLLREEKFRRIGADLIYDHKNVRIYRFPPSSSQPAIAMRDRGGKVQGSAQ